MERRQFLQLAATAAVATVVPIPTTAATPTTVLRTSGFHPAWMRLFIHGADAPVTVWLNGERHIVLWSGHVTRGHTIGVELPIVVTGSDRIHIDGATACYSLQWIES